MQAMLVSGSKPILQKPDVVKTEKLEIEDDKK